MTHDSCSLPVKLPSLDTLYHFLRDEPGRLGASCGKTCGCLGCLPLLLISVGDLRAAWFVSVLSSVLPLPDSSAQLKGMKMAPGPGSLWGPRSPWMLGELQLKGKDCRFPLEPGGEPSCRSAMRGRLADLIVLIRPGPSESGVDRPCPAACAKSALSSAWT